jgi:hypothetical protein
MNEEIEFKHIIMYKAARVFMARKRKGRDPPEE